MPSRDDRDLPWSHPPAVPRGRPGPRRRRGGWTRLRWGHRSACRWRVPPGTALTPARCRQQDRKSTRLNSSHLGISYAVFFLNDTATTEIYTLSLHDALPIFGFDGVTDRRAGGVCLQVLH